MDATSQSPPSPPESTGKGWDTDGASDSDPDAAVSAPESYESLIITSLADDCENLSLKSSEDDSSKASDNTHNNGIDTSSKRLIQRNSSSSEHEVSTEDTCRSHPARHERSDSELSIKRNSMSSEPDRTRSTQELDGPTTKNLWEELIESTKVDHTKVSIAVRREFLTLSPSLALEVVAKFSSSRVRRNSTGKILSRMIRNAKRRRGDGAETKEKWYDGISQKVRKKIESIKSHQGPAANFVFGPLAMKTLRSMGEEEQLELLEGIYCSNLKKKKNKSGFIKNIYCEKKAAKRVLEEALKSLHPQVSATFKQCLKRKKLTLNDFQAKHISYLNTLPIDVAVDCVSKLKEANLEYVRNKDRFFLTIMKRCARKLRSETRQAEKEKLRSMSLSSMQPMMHPYPIYPVYPVPMNTHAVLDTDPNDVEGAEDPCHPVPEMIAMMPSPYAYPCMSHSYPYPYPFPYSYTYPHAYPATVHHRGPQLTPHTSGNHAVTNPPNCIEKESTKNTTIAVVDEDDARGGESACVHGQ
jgi:hypothetical protein